jgi:hypothetical protein
MWQHWCALCRHPAIVAITTSLTRSDFSFLARAQPPAPGSKEKSSSSKSASSSNEGSSRPSRGSAFDDPDDQPEASATAAEAAAASPEGGAIPSPDTPAAGDAAAAAAASQPEPSAEWQAASPGIADDMRAHLKRREKKAEADLIKRNRGPVTSVLFGLGDFLRSRYFSNVRKSLSVFFGMWFWYVLNTKTYQPPEIDD